VFGVAPFICFTNNFHTQTMRALRGLVKYHLSCLTITLSYGDCLDCC
jgi:hypothetical protein